jgi:uncharacterized protein YegP (UPF0339 family)/outer membrane protein OmpA-like peptidoglycan-associated protein
LKKRLFFTQSKQTIMVNEDYLACSAYEGQKMHETATDFSAFFHEETQQYFFALLDADGEVLLKSEGYPQPAARENGIQSVIKNRINREFYSVKEDDGRYYLSLRAANYREIARSCHFDSEGDALALIAYATGEQTRAKSALVAETKERANDRIDDDYMACKSYAGHGGAGNAVVGFTHESGQHYFTWYDDDGDVLMRSEGYPTTAARDNGMASVAKNGELEERYAVLEKMGRYFVILKAGNHQEIARSCPFDSEAAARAIFPSGRAETARLKAEAIAAAAAAKAEEEAAAARALVAAKAEEEAAAAAKAAQEAAAASAAASVAAVATADASSDRREDNYLACRQYDGHEGADEAGFTKWQHTDGQYYFSWLDDNGKVKMRSEGYPTTAARDNGVDSVMRNRDNADRYKVVELAGKTFVTLRAGNHQEIARSCAKEDMTAVWAMFPLLAPPDVAAARELEPVDDIAPVDIEDDYLPCRDYHGHMTAPRDGFRVFISNKTDKYYFAVVDAEDDVTLRSEGHLTAAERDADMADVIQNMLKKERYEIKHVGLHHYFIVLRNAAGKEIARSCGHDSLASVYAAAPFLNPEKPAAKIDIAAPLTIGATALAATAAAATRVVEPTAVVEVPSVPTPPADVEDDYLPCREYEGKTINDKGNNVSMFKHSNGQFYFAVYNADGSVRLRSEGFKTSQDRDKELSGVLKNLNNASMYTTIRRGEYYISVLKDKTGREVGRSCMQKDVPTPVVAAPIVAAAAAVAVAAAIPEVKVATPKVATPPPVYVAPEIAEPVTKETGFNWWWLLLPLLALLGWLLMGKGCNTAPVAPAAVTIETPKVEPAPAVVETPKVAAAPSCNLNWILFDFDKADITTAASAELAEMAKILKENKDYVGVLSAHTDGKGSVPYNEDLSKRRAAAAKRALVAMGIEASRLKTAADGKGRPVAQNTDDDAGRRFNRRVELYVQDKTGKDICQSIPPAIPDALKATN